MRKKKTTSFQDLRVFVIDDDQGIIDSLNVILGRLGYVNAGMTNPHEAVHHLKDHHYDLLILDYLMEDMYGDQVVSEIREFDQDMYILLLTGHKDLAPPMETIKRLDIQGYCEKSDKFDQLILLIESGIKSVQQMQRIRKYEEGLGKILTTVPKIYQLGPIDDILKEILVGIIPLVNSEDAYILYDQNQFQPKSIFRGIGKFDMQVEEFMQQMALVHIEAIGVARANREIVYLKNGCVFPLVNENNEAIGAIYVDLVSPQLSMDKPLESLQLLDIYAKQASAALSNAFLHCLVNMKNEELKKTYDDLRKHYLETIELLRLAVDARDEYTRGHSDRVSYYATRIGRNLGLSESDCELLRLGGAFHDIGKIGTSDDILYKSESLSKEEYNEIKRHPVKGSHILSAVSMFSEVVPLIRAHHEHVDGRGYPYGLKEEEIPFLARILSVADAFDAMTSDRLYRTKMGYEEAKNQLINASGSQFDRMVVENFVGLLNTSFDKMREELAHTFV